jgi:hypothetical protein
MKINKKTLIFLLLIISIIITIFMVFNSVKKPNIQIQINAPESIKSGEIFDATIVIENKSNLNIKNAEVFLKIPNKIKAIDSNLDFEIDKLDSNETIQKTISLLGTGNELEELKLNAILKYSPENIKSFFEIQNEKNVVVRGNIFDVKITAISKTLPENDFRILVQYKNLSEKRFDNLNLRVQSTTNYNVINSSIPFKNNSFYIGALPENTEGTLEINSTFSGKGNNEEKITFCLGYEYNGEFLCVTEKNLYVDVLENPLEVNLNIPNNVNPGDTAKITVAYKNNYTVPLSNLELNIVLDHKLFDTTNIKINNGYYNSSLKTVFFKPANIPSLARISSGEQGQVSFEVGIKDNYIIKSYTDKNFNLNIKAFVQGNIVLDKKHQNIQASDQKSIKLNTKVDFISYIKFRDNETGIINCGSLPLKVNQETCFTVHWAIKNYYNDLKNVKITAKLSNGVSYTGRYIGGSDVEYNGDKQEFILYLDSVKAGNGFIIKPEEFIFQIKTIPSSQEVELPKMLFDKVTIEGTDSFTNQNIQFELEGFNTNILNDASILPGYNIVFE